MSATELSGDTLLLSGPVTGLTVVDIDKHTRAMAGFHSISLEAVSTVDTQGLALIAQLVGRAAASGARPRVIGNPAGLSELCLAYRIEPDFSDFP